MEVPSIVFIRGVCHVQVFVPFEEGGDTLRETVNDWNRASKVVGAGVAVSTDVGIASGD